MATFTNYVYGLIAPIITNVGNVLSKVSEFHDTISQMNAVHSASIVNGTLTIDSSKGTKFSATIADASVLLTAIPPDINTDTWLGTIVLTVTTDALLLPDTNVSLISPPNMSSGSIFKCDLVYSGGTTYVLFERLK